MSNSTIMAFDYGSKRIGVAIGQQLTASTQPLETVAVRQNKPDWDHISRLLQEWQPGLLLIGLPLTEDGSEQEMSIAARRFANRLNGRYQLPVELVDERFSSIEAEELVVNARRNGRLKKSKLKQAVDQIAAELIIQTWLTEQQQPL